MWKHVWYRTVCKRLQILIAKISFFFFDPKFSSEYMCVRFFSHNFIAIRSCWFNSFYFYAFEIFATVYLVTFGHKMFFATRSNYPLIYQIPSIRFATKLSNETYENKDIMLFDKIILRLIYTCNDNCKRNFDRSLRERLIEVKLDLLLDVYIGRKHAVLNPR